MRSYLAAFVQALALCVVLTPLARLLALRLGAVSAPGGRNTNERAIPRLGGLAIALSAMAPMATLLFVDSSVASFIRQWPDQVLGLLVGGSAMCLLGLIDDVRERSARTKLLTQVVVAAFAYYVGFRIDGIALPLLEPIQLHYLGLPFTVLWIVGITNAVNLIDGLDGLAAGVVFFAAVSNLVVALLGDEGTGTIFVALLMASMMGSLLGFLFYNFNPARIFMGDSGSYFLGFLLATSSIMAPLQKASTTVSLLVPIVALGLPIFDTLFSMMRRYLEHRPMFSADRGHVHHRLLDMGITHRRAVVTLYGACIVLATSAVTIAMGRDWEIGLGLLGASVVLIGLIRAVRSIDRSNRSLLLDHGSTHLRQALPSVLDQLAHARRHHDVERGLETLREALSVSAVVFEVDGEERLLAGQRALARPPAGGRIDTETESRGLALMGRSGRPSPPSGAAAEPRAETTFRSGAANHRFPVAAGQTLVLHYDAGFVLAPSDEVLVQVVADQVGLASAQLERKGSPREPSEEASEIVARKSRVGR